MRLVLSAALALQFAVAFALPAQFPPAQLKNIKALPADIKVGPLIEVMKGFTRALGVRCQFCHVGQEGQDLATFDFPSDDRPAKDKAREMIRMVDAINTQFLTKLTTRRDPAITVTCATCHRGVTQPRPIQQVVMTAYQNGGITAADSTYRALRNRNYGSASYDFGEVPLSDVADNLIQQKQPADAIRILKLNAELLPTSGFAFRQLGFAYLGTADTASALAAFKKRLELTPNNPEAKQLVDMLTKKPAPTR